MDDVALGYLCLCFLLVHAGKSDAAISVVENQSDASGLYSALTDWPYCEQGGIYTLPHSKFCDRFFTCQQGDPYLGQCRDGYGYVPFTGCRLLHLVDCTTRPMLQPPKSNSKCPRLYGLFEDPQGCGRFFKCDNGTAVPDRCPSELAFDDIHKVCRQPTEREKANCAPVQTAQTTPGFKCPVESFYTFGDHSRHPYPGHCGYFIMCLRDGGIKVGSCEPGQAFSYITKNCELASNVAGCESTG
uniref:(California timema) hypothetical protein n=1 Tax=Timema californicum TaxID=61474 RepID=A0A7R9J1D7_TIMCA|nr:unnamed protein product [Timema californicum]